MTHDGIKFKSQDEIRFWEYCKRRKAKEEIVNFEYESEKITLIPAFQFQGEKIRTMTYTPDFVIYENDGSVTYIEVKGFLTPEAKIKVKLFKYYLSGRENVKYLMLARSLVHATIDGEWIPYDELQKKRRDKRNGK